MYTQIHTYLRNIWTYRVCHNNVRHQGRRILVVDDNLFWQTKCCQKRSRLEPPHTTKNYKSVQQGRLNTTRNYVAKNDRLRRWILRIDMRHHFLVLNLFYGWSPFTVFPSFPWNTLNLSSFFFFFSSFIFFFGGGGDLSKLFQAGWRGTEYFVWEPNHFWLSMGSRILPFQHAHTLDPLVI